MARTEARPSDVLRRPDRAVTPSPGRVSTVAHGGVTTGRLERNRRNALKEQERSRRVSMQGLVDCVDHRAVDGGHLQIVSEPGPSASPGEEEGGSIGGVVPTTAATTDGQPLVLPSRFIRDQVESESHEFWVIRELVNRREANPEGTSRVLVCRLLSSTKS